MQDLSSHRDIKSRYRLVQDQDFGIDGKRARDGNALALTAAELVGMTVRCLGRKLFFAYSDNYLIDARDPTPNPLQPIFVTKSNFKQTCIHESGRAIATLRNIAARFQALVGDPLLWLDTSLLDDARPLTDFGLEESLERGRGGPFFFDRCHT